MSTHKARRPTTLAKSVHSLLPTASRLWHLAALLMIAALTLGFALLAKEVSGDETVSLGTPSDTIYTAHGFYDPEKSAEQGTYRWTLLDAQITLPGWGPGRVHVIFRGVEGSASPRVATLLYNGTVVDQTSTRPGQPWSLQGWISTETRNPVITLTSPPLVAPGDNRSLGLLTREMEIYAPDARLRAFLNLALLGFTAILLYLSLLAWFGNPLLALSTAVALLSMLGPLVVYRDRWMATVVWVAPALLAGLLLHGHAGGWARSGAPVRKRSWLVVLALTAFLLLLTQGFLNAFDSERMYSVAGGLAEFGRPSRYPSLNGYTKYGFGLSLMGVPFYWLGKLGTLAGGSYDAITRFTVSMTNLPVTAITCWLLYRASRRFAGTGVSLAVAGTYLLATPALNYGRTFFSETAGGALLLAATLLVVPPPGEVAPAPRRVVAAGALLGGMVWLKPAFALFLVAPGLVVVVLWLLAARSTEQKSPPALLRRAATAVLLYSIGPLIAGVVQILYDLLRYAPLADAWRRTGYEKEPGFTTPLFEGLGGLLFSPGKSLFLFAPPLLLVPLGLWLTYRRGLLSGRVAAVLVAAQTLASLLFNATWWAWTGNFAWGPRLIMPVLPLLAWTLAPVGQYAMRGAATAFGGIMNYKLRIAPRGLLWLWGTLVVLGALVSIPGALVNFQLYFEEHGLVLAGDPGESATIYDPAHSPLIEEPGYLLYGVTAAIQRPTLEDAGLPAAWDVLVPGALTLLSVVLLRAARRRPPCAVESAEDGLCEDVI